MSVVCHPATTITAPTAHGLPAGRAHLIGIGGSGMGALAVVLRGRGWEVTGSDQGGRPGDRIAPLHAEKNVPGGADLVVRSAAVGPDNCECQAAHRLGIPVVTYAQMLGRLVAQAQCGLAVAGTHGKSTTVAMAAEILSAAGRDPTVVGGAAARGRATGGRAGRGGHTLVEACEYAGNFLHLRPDVAVILPIEADHFDCYPRIRDLATAFARFAHHTDRRGRLLVRAECRLARWATRRVACRRELLAVGRNRQALPEVVWWAEPLGAAAGRYRFRLWKSGLAITSVSLRVTGRHQVGNALAAAALALRAGATATAVREGLERFAGLGRRLETRGRLGDVRWVDDYAHHPTEIDAGLAALREEDRGADVWCVFQPHQFVRTARLLHELAASLTRADRVLVAPIFAAREPAGGREQVSAADLAREVCRLGGQAEAFSTLDKIETRLAAAIRGGELTVRHLLVTMGAGDVDRVGPGLAARLATEHDVADYCLVKPNFSGSDRSIPRHIESLS